MIESTNNILDIPRQHLKSVESKKETKNTFTSLLQKNIEKVNNLQKNADKLKTDFALGKTDNIHSVTIATEKARIAMDLTVAIQSKVMNAYKEIMRMQV
mgnify:CR=1 FL=1